MNLKTTKKLLMLIFFAVIFAVVAASLLNSQVLTYGMIGLLIAYALIFMLGWKCPKCKKPLGKLNARRCRHCGHELDV